MSSDAVDAATDRADQGQALVPRLRFPKFRDAGDWEQRPLGTFAELIDERVGHRPFTPLSITSGVGLVSQEEKFGRTIAGQQLKNYLVLRNGDFAYNKSATKSYPQGYAVMYKGDEPGCVPGSIFTCLRVTDNSVCNEFVDFLLSANLHGRWLSRFTTTGARANGSLNVDDGDLLALPFPLPRGVSKLAEQRKIADCLSSLDSVIAAERERLATLQDHKKGLLQALFPAEGRTTPRLRFPDFQNAGAWTEKTIGGSSKSFSGGTPSTSVSSFYGGDIPFIRSAEIDASTTELTLTITGLAQSSAKMVAQGDVLIALYGANSGNAAISKIAGAINQAVLALRHESSSEFLFHFWTGRQEWITKRYLQGGQGNLSAEIVKSIHMPTPDANEQRIVATCLTSVDHLIGAQRAKVAQLGAFKAGLIQQLFPWPPEATA